MLIYCFFTTLVLTLDLQMYVLNKDYKIFENDSLQNNFNSKIYDNTMRCTNGQLQLIEFESNSNQTFQFRFQNVQNLTQQEIQIKYSPNPTPKPNISHFYSQNNTFIIQRNCETTLDKSNYYNRIQIIIKDEYSFSFLMNCDKGGRHKKFQNGYLIIAIINAIIIIGVALHSRIWSLRWNGRPFSIELLWYRFMFIMFIILACFTGILLYANKYFYNANLVIKYTGIACSMIFVFICCNEIFYLFKPLLKQIVGPLRICQIFSFIISIASLLFAIFVQSWIFYNFLAISICVGCIKLLNFRSMYQAFLSMFINIISVTTIAIVFHYVLDRSYNDQASQLASPFFIEVPDLVQNLFKKCSWLPVIDVILPGVLLSLLRNYDQNFNTGWGGVYTVIGNVSFIVSTIIWILLEAVYPWSIPFSLVTYPLFLLSIGIIARKRNQFKTLWYGRFNMINDISSSLFFKEESIENASQQVESLNLDQLKYHESINSQIDSNDR